VIAIYARENGQGMAFPVPVPGATPAEEPVPTKPSPLSRVPAAPAEAPENRVVQLVTPPEEGATKPPETEPPKPPAGPRPALKRIK
jgi:stringent starvation protein B